jgi:membrane protein implicated in regulation of membrane protease activity
VIAAATIVVLAAELYFGAGLLFAILFAWRGAAAVDAAAREGTLGFKLLILPASALLWPLLLRRWLRHAPPPAEHNAHRDAAREGRP